MKPVTDPALLAQLEAPQPSGAGKPVTDPNLIAQLEGRESPAMERIMSTRAPRSVDDARAQENAAFAREAIKTDIQQSDGFFDSVGDFFQRGIAALDSGAARVGGALQEWNAETPLPWTSPEATAQAAAMRDALRTAARGGEAIVGTPVAGEATWGDVKADPISADTLKFIGQQGVQSLPGMVQAVIGAPLYLAGAAGNIAQDRALNDGREDAQIGDVAAATPAAVLSTALERVGAKGILSSPAKTMAGRIGKSAAKEGATEFGQGVIEYAGGTVGTEKGFDPATAVEQGAAGALVGVGVGGAGRGAVEIVKKPVDIATDLLQRRAEERQAAQTPIAPIEPVAAPEAPVAPVVQPVIPEPVPDASVGVASVEPQPAPVPAPDVVGGLEGAKAPAIEADLGIKELGSQAAEISQKTPEIQPKELGPKVELDRSGITSPDKGAYQDKFVEASFTDRASIYTSAAREMGVDPDKFQLLPPQRQTKLLADSVKRKFGVTVDVDPKLQKRFAVDQMTDMHQTVQGMAHVLGISEKAIGLGGALKLKLSKNSQFLGAYSPGNKQIILPKRSNSFAHEWAHALDYHLLEKVGNDQARGITGKIRQDGANFAPQNVSEAFVKLLNTMFFDQTGNALKIMDLEKGIAATSSEKQRAALQAQIDNIKSGRSQSRTTRSEFYKGSASLNKSGMGDYWTQPTEMFARAFEAYVSHMATTEGLGTEFIGKGDANYLSGAEERFAKSFPKAQERELIFEAMGEMMQQLHQESMIDGDGERAAKPDMNEVRRLTDFDRHVDEVKEGGVLKREMDAIQRQMRQRAEAMADRAKDPKNVANRAKDVAATALFSMSGKMQMIAKRWKSPTVKRIHDLLMHTPGKGEGVGETFHEAVEAKRNHTLNRLSNILKTANLTKMDKGQSRMLRDLLIGEDVKDAPAEMVTAAANIRRLLDNEFYRNQQAGVDIGYVQQNGYLARNLDIPRVLHDEPAFLAKAAEVYGIQFDNELEAEIAASMEDADGNLPDSEFLKKVAKGLGTKDISDVDALREGYAGMMSEAWLAKIKGATPYDFDKHSPESSYAKKRALPKEADKILEDFYTQDPIETVVDYIGKSVRRAEYAKRFGPNNEKRAEFAKSMTAEGVPSEDQQEIFNMLDIATGTNRKPMARSVENFLSFVHAYGTLRLLPRAVIASLVEPVTAGITAGDFRVGMKALTATVMGTKTMNGKQRAELARAMGLVTDIIADDILEARFGGTYGNVTRWDKVTSTMFQRTGLIALTKAQRSHSIAASHAYLDNLAHKVEADGDAGASALLKELGIKDPAVFAAELVKMKRLPTVEELDTAFGQDYSLATRRFVDMTIQNPNPMTRPQLANHPVGRIIYGITSFSMAFWRNVIKRQGILIAEIAKREGAVPAAAHIAALAPAAFTLFALQTAVSTIREWLFNQERWEELDEKDELEKTMLQLGLSRSFSLGIAEPAIQAATGLKYQRDLSNIMVGPAPGVILQNAQTMATLFIRNSEKTNTAEWNATRDAYNLMVAPSIAYGLSVIPGGPVVGAAAGAGLITTTSPRGGDEFADLVIGEKDKKSGKRKGEASERERGGARERE